MLNEKQTLKVLKKIKKDAVKAREIAMDGIKDGKYEPEDISYYSGKIDLVTYLIENIEKQ